MRARHRFQFVSSFAILLGFGAGSVLAQSDAPTLEPGPPNQAFTPPSQPFNPGATVVPQVPPAIVNPPPTAAPGPLAAPNGQSSIATEGQARSLLQAMGYNVTNLMQDPTGAWRGVAQQGGRTVFVGVDAQGNVTAQ